MSTAWATIIGAAVAALASIVVCVVNNNRQNAVMFYRLEQLEKKVALHNNLVERMYKVEEQTAVLDTKQKVADHRLDDLEKKAG